MAKNVALITGASSGIGLEFAILHAQQGGDLVIVARREEVLQQLKADLENEFGISVMVVVADLADVDSAVGIYSACKEQGIEVDILINNAGFGGHGKFHEQQWDVHAAMLQVNTVALTQLTYLFLQDMVGRNRGKVLNVASTAAFMPGPLQAVYYATKSYVLSLTQAIAKDLEGTQLTATALCPGAVATGFVEAANLEGVEIFDNAASPEDVAKCGYEAMMKGELVAFNDSKLSFMLKWIVPLLPRKTVLNLSEKTMLKSSN